MLISFVLLNYSLVLCVGLCVLESIPYLFDDPFSLLLDIIFEHQTLPSVI